MIIIINTIYYYIEVVKFVKNNKSNKSPKEILNLRLALGKINNKIVISETGMFVCGSNIEPK